MYDIRNDPNELRNLAKEQKFKKVIEEHLEFVPQFNRSPAKRKPEWDINRGEIYVICQGKRFALKTTPSRRCIKMSNSSAFGEILLYVNSK